MKSQFVEYMHEITINLIYFTLYKLLNYFRKVSCLINTCYSFLQDASDIIQTFRESIKIVEMGSVCCKRSKKERIFSQRVKIQRPIPFLCIKNDFINRRVAITEEGKRYLLGLPNGTNLIFVTNYTNQQQLRLIFLDKYISFQQKQIKNHENIKVYLTTIGHYDNYTAVLLDCLHQNIEKHIFQILITISSTFLLLSPKQQPSINDISPIIPLSLEALNLMRKFGKQMNLPTFMWFHRAKIYNYVLRPETQFFYHDYYQTKKRNLDLKLFKQLYRDIGIQHYEQAQKFNETYKEQLRLKILGNLEPREIIGLKFSPRILIRFINYFGNKRGNNFSIYQQKYFKQDVQSFYKGLMQSLIQEYKLRQQSKEKSKRNIQREILELVDQYKSKTLSQKSFENFVNKLLKTKNLSSIEEMMKRQKSKADRKQKQIDFSQIEEYIDRQITESKLSICQLLAVERKRLESDGNSLSGAAKVDYLEKVRDFFDQKMSEEMLRLEKENAVKSKQNAILQVENERIKMKLQCESEKSSTSNQGSDLSELMNLSKQELL